MSGGPCEHGAGGGSASERGVCAYPWQQMNVDLTGEVVPCCFWSGYGNAGRPLGNTNEQTLQEIWNGEAWQELRRANAEGPPPGHPCHQCLAWTWSGGRYPAFTWPVSFRPESGLCFVAPIPERFAEAVAGLDEPVLLHEDGEPLPHPDALHDDIRQHGGGRYSVWGDTLYFSSRDGSDPATNGRAYELVCGGHRARLGNLVVDSTSGRNLLAARAEYEAAAAVMTARPTMLSFISSADCNIDCPACSQNTVRLLGVRHRERTEADVLALVPYLHQFVWHGGEPYLVRGFRAFVDGFRTDHNPNLTFGFTSNGTLLDTDELDKLARFPRVNASVSVDSFSRDTFEAIRAGARFDTVLRNVLAAIERYDGPAFVLNVGMIVTKANFTELPENLAFALQHDIGLNLSPVVIYPVTDRIDVFRDFHAQTDGWWRALDRAEEVLAEARARGARALRRVDPTGHVAALRQILRRAAQRYARVFPLTVTVEDPTGSLPKMRRPGLVVARESDGEHPLAYLEIDRGPGEYLVVLPRAELGGPRKLHWSLLHDLLEPMGVLDDEPFVDREHRLLSDAGWTEMPTRLLVEVPPFEAPPRPRNIRMVEQVAPADALHVTDPGQLFEAYRRLQQHEREQGVGAVAGPVDGALLRALGNRLRPRRYGGFVTLAD